MACIVCGRPVKPVIGRGRQPLYCGPRCRRRQEKARASWDMRAAMVAELGYYAQNRDLLGRTPEQQAYWQAELDRAVAEFAALGPRP